MTQPRLVLASGSPQRHQLMTAAGYDFEVVVPNDSAECGICSTGGPAELVADLALRKAIDVAGQLAGREKVARLILACDTVAECDGAVLGKPTDEDHARDMLQRLRGQLHRVYSGLCLLADDEPDTEAAAEIGIATTELRMDHLADAELDDYLASGLWRGKAGAFGYQDRAGWLHVEHGSETNVIGLPMELLAEMLAPHGYRQ